MKRNEEGSDERSENEVLLRLTTVLASYIDEEACVDPERRTAE